MPTIQQLLDDARLSASELSRLSNVDYRTAKKAVDARGEKIKRVKLLALLQVLNERTGGSYKPEDVQGIVID